MMYPTSGYQVVYRFEGGQHGPDPANPSAGLTKFRGILYGTTESGGENSWGSVFTVTPSGKEKTLYSFKGQMDGALPEASLTAVNGTFFGTTQAGGGTPYGEGTVFEVTAKGAEKVVYAFRGEPDGSRPLSTLIPENGFLYGTTVNGGTGSCGTSGCGTIFKVTESGSESIIHSFAGAPDGAYPESGLLYFDGAFYGTTAEGGPNNNGTVFKITPSGTEYVIYSFKSMPDGTQPQASLTALGGVLYGSTMYGGAHDGGTVFSITTLGSERVIYSFRHNSKPTGKLLAANGTLYGTTSCGSGCDGEAFMITTSGDVTFLHHFGRANDGSSPNGGLIVLKRQLYGTTHGGGLNLCDGNGCGTVFRLDL
ncbi:MAG: choice-of-anchor tandem repeat GloVer-containing protein [Candidatus Cybelea sp.]